MKLEINCKNFREEYATSFSPNTASPFSKGYIFGSNSKVEITSSGESKLTEQDKTVDVHNLYTLTTWAVENQIKHYHLLLYKEDDPIVDRIVKNYFDRIPHEHKEEINTIEDLYPVGLVTSDGIALLLEDEVVIGINNKEEVVVNSGLHNPNLASKVTNGQWIKGKDTFYRINLENYPYYFEVITGIEMDETNTYDNPIIKCLIAGLKISAPKFKTLNESLLRLMKENQKHFSQKLRYVADPYLKMCQIPIRLLNS